MDLHIDLPILKFYHSINNLLPSLILGHLLTAAFLNQRKFANSHLLCLPFILCPSFILRAAS